MLPVDNPPKIYFGLCGNINGTALTQNTHIFQIQITLQRLFFFLDNGVFLAQIFLYPFYFTVQAI